MVRSEQGILMGIPQGFFASHCFSQPGVGRSFGKVGDNTGDAIYTQRKEDGIDESAHGGPPELV